MITQERKDYLTSQGWSIEDMGKEWGSDFNGQYRCTNYRNDEWGIVQYSIDDAWEDCSQYHDQLWPEVK